jgi:AraC-like DNA-binding protein
VAALVNVSTRTLSRRLREEGTSYEGILDALRRDLSRRHLRDARVTIDEVALMLGYAEMRAFRRAFQRWYGMSPAVFRREGRSPGSPAR